MSEQSSRAADAGDRFDIVIVGGGAAGALVATHLLADAGHGLRVALVEPRAVPGQGIAYSTARNEHLLNVVAGRMSAFDAAPDDFVEFLRGRPELAAGTPTDALPGLFASRMAYGRYLHERLAAQPGHPALARFADTVVDAMPAAGGYRLRLASGGTLSAPAVVLATGNRLAGLPLAADAADAAPAIGAWDYPAVAAIDPDADVCVVGAGLSMVDVALTLARNGHRGRIEVLSRHALLPLAHAVPTHGAVAERGAPMPAGTRARMRRVRADAAAAQAAGQPWQWAIDALRRETQTLWASSAPVEQRRFLRHAMRYWDIHRHRIAPPAAAVLAGLVADGRLRLHAGRLRAVEAADGGVAVDYAPRGGAGTTRIRAGVVVNAVGLEKRPVAVPGSLLAAMHARGLLRPGPHGIGVATVGDGEVLGTDGRPVAGLWTLGAMRLGDLWETIAIPELRGQAERVAALARAHARAAGR